ncbi:MAG: CPBP family intramembrane metalloprotease, partial [Dehalococcoidia bacterium]|nr:CPBP family intramembrane metalloprotease [Dehalococcoidia bacterium]
MKTAILYLAAITAAELIVSLVHPLWGIIFHVFILMGLIYHSSISTTSPAHRLYMALALAPLIRIFSLSLPLVNFPQIYWYAIVAVPVLASVFIVMRKLSLRPAEIGIRAGSLPYQLLIGLSGIPFGIAEYYILRPPQPLSPPTWTGIMLGALILMIGTGFAEELTFRGVLQKLAGEALGKWGWIYVAVLFATLHIGYLLVTDLLFVLAVGLFFGWAVKRTGSLLGTTLAHGLANIF